MRNVHAWAPNKFEKDAHGRWRASRTEVPITSRLIADLAAAAYAQAIEAHASGRLADLGCGKVPLYGMYRDKVTDVVCIDWPSSLHQNLHVDEMMDLNKSIDLEAESFDTIIATDVIEHLHTPQVLFAGAARALRAGGKLIIGVPFLYWIHEPPHDYHRYTRFALAKMATDAGLVVVSVVSLGGAPEVLADVASKAMAVRPRLAGVIHTFSRMLLGLSIIKRISVQTRDTLPLGYVLVAQKPRRSMLS